MQYIRNNNTKLRKGKKYYQTRVGILQELAQINAIESKDYFERN